MKKENDNITTNNSTVESFLYKILMLCLSDSLHWLFIKRFNICFVQNDRSICCGDIF